MFLIEPLLFAKKFLSPLGYVLLFEILKFYFSIFLHRNLQFFKNICNEFWTPVPPLSISKNRKKYFQIFTPSFFEFFAILRNLTIKSMQFLWLAFPILGALVKRLSSRICDYIDIPIITNILQNCKRKWQQIQPVCL